MESGLPTGTNWSVSFASTVRASETNTIGFTAPNGTYPFLVTGVSGYNLTPTSGNLTVAGHEAEQAVTFTNLTAPHPLTITEAGSSVLLPLMIAWGLNYSQVDPNVTLQTAGGGSGSGTSQAELGLVDIGASDAYLANSSDSNLVDLPVALTGDMIVYQIPGLSASDHLNLNGTLLAEIYAGTISTWTNPLVLAAQNATVQSSLTSLSNASITVVKRSDANVDTFVVSALCYLSWTGWPFGVSTSAFGALNRANVVPAEGDAGVVSTVGATPGAIGYVGLADSGEVTVEGLGVAAMGTNESLSSSGGTNLSNYVLPTAANVTEDAELGFTQVDLSSYGLAVSLVLGGSPEGPLNLTLGAGGSNPTVADPTPYPLASFEYVMIKDSPGGSVVTPAALAATVHFLTWAVENDSVTTGGTPLGPFLGAVPLYPDPIEVVRSVAALLTMVVTSDSVSTN